MEISSPPPHLVAFLAEPRGSIASCFVCFMWRFCDGWGVAGWLAGFQFGNMITDE